MAAHERAPLRVAVLADSEPRREAVGVLLQRQGFVVVSCIAPHELDTPARIAEQGVDLLLVDLDENGDVEPDALLGLIEGCPVPVLINDATASTGQADLGPRLARKFRALSGQRPRRLRRTTDAPGAPPETAAETAPEAVPEAVPEVESSDHSPALESAEPTPAAAPSPAGGEQEVAPADPDPSPMPAVAALPDPAPPAASKTPATGERDAAAPNRALPQAPAPRAPDRARRVWVLGASLGGPQAVRAFLSRLPGDLPVAFILAQHIGEGFDRLLASQLNRETALSVSCARAGARLRDGEVMLAPLDQSLRLDRDGCVTLQPRVESGIYSPSIDDVMSEVARCYRASAGAIVFSGMGDDGIEGARAIAGEGGVVWAQDAASAVISSMPDHARRAGVVSLSGPPGQLADQLVKTLAASGSLAAL